MFDATVLAKQFGGGGHIRAAGCTVKGSMASAKRQVRRAVKEMLLKK
jgi:phosphoesterase RecJ-like protein